MKSYEEYKDSGIEWIGEIPKNWKISKFKYFLEINENGIWGKEPEKNKNNIMEILRSTEISEHGHWKINDPAKRAVPTGDIKNYKLINGDLLIVTSSGSKNHLGKTALVNKKIQDEEYLFSNFMQRLRFEDNLNSKFCYYLLNSKIAKEQIKYLSTTTTGLNNISAKILNNIQFPFISNYEQQKIASFLDKKTTAIDSIIEKKEKLIEKLEAYKKSVITEAVTKGKLGDKFINEDGELVDEIEMKDSGEKRLGNIPKYWQTKKLKYITRLEYGDSLPTNKRQEGNIPVFGSNGKIGNHNFSNTLSSSIIIGRKGSYGKIKFSNQPCFCIDTTYYIDNSLTDAYLPWLYYTLNTLKLDTITLDSAVPGLNRNLVYNIYIPDINNEIQKEIANFLDKETKKITDLIDKTQQSIKKYKAYKKSLIYEAVTGKIDLRDYDEGGNNVNPDNS